MNELAVGTRYPKYQNYSDDIRFDVADDGANLIISYNNPTVEEKNWFCSGKPLQVRFITLHDVIYLLFKFDNSPWMDAPYSPHLSINMTQKISIDSNTTGLSLTIFLFDSSTGELQHIRLVGLGNQLSKTLIKEIYSIKKKPFNRGSYDDSIRRTYARYTTEDMVKMTMTSFKLQ
ncbi:hypothetical protein H0486_17285 [Lachnospiraceae bacterium MD1]|jgi:hypothetical protein|uniref:Uncharacterized protein n=1 Tax=Variimorphobacter saccharofermentans TaxID=2755051 RepID=A0A839K5M6_9FIRM|nr:hypothetical protein [Variimorphobacter saccharofermentans]MBB2184627.1 hypothetical protein [Variimorphobacter saccharofermentans]